MKLDSLYNIRWALVQQSAFAWIATLDKIKHKAPNQVVMGAAICFLLVCKRFKLEPREVLTVTDRVIRRARDVAPQYITGIEEYLKKELPHDES